MVSWTKLLTGEYRENDAIRYSGHEDPAPKIVVWNTTSLCNFNCRHCYLDASQIKIPDELNHQEAEGFVADLSRLGVSVLIFSGGEPLLRKDIFELGRYASDKGLSCALSTNGALITKDVAKMIRGSGFHYVGISLDGKEATNDRFRQNKGAYRRTLEGLRNCQDAGLKVGLRFTLTRYNFKDLAHIFELTEKESVSRLCVYHLVYSGRGRVFLNRDLSHHQTRGVSEFIWRKVLDLHERNVKIEVLSVDNHADGVWIYLKMKKRDPHRAKEALKLLEAQGGNGSGRTIACMDHRGDIYADQFLRTHSLGNIRQRRFSAIWQDERNSFLLALRDRRELLKGRCVKCAYITICNGNFRARAEAVFGDIWREDPSCYLTDKEIYNENDEAYAASSRVGVDA